MSNTDLNDFKQSHLHPELVDILLVSGCRSLTPLQNLIIPIYTQNNSVHLISHSRLQRNTKASTCAIIIANDLLHNIGNKFVIVTDKEEVSQTYLEQITQLLPEAQERTLVIDKKTNLRNFSPDKYDIIIAEDKLLVTLFAKKYYLLESFNTFIFNRPVNILQHNLQQQFDELLNHIEKPSYTVMFNTKQHVDTIQSLFANKFNKINQVNYNHVSNEGKQKSATVQASILPSGDVFYLMNQSCFSVHKLSLEKPCLVVATAPTLAEIAVYLQHSSMSFDIIDRPFKGNAKEFSQFVHDKNIVLIEYETIKESATIDDDSIQTIYLNVNYIQEYDLEFNKTVNMLLCLPNDIINLKYIHDNIANISYIPIDNILDNVQVPAIPSFLGHKKRKEEYKVPNLVLPKKTKAIYNKVHFNSSSTLKDFRPNFLKKRITPITLTDDSNIA